MCCRCCPDSIVLVPSRVCWNASTSRNDACMQACMEQRPASPYFRPGVPHTHTSTSSQAIHAHTQSTQTSPHPCFAMPHITPRSRVRVVRHPLARHPSSVMRSASCGVVGAGLVWRSRGCWMWWALSCCWWGAAASWVSVCFRA